MTGALCDAGVLCIGIGYAQYFLYSATDQHTASMYVPRPTPVTGAERRAASTGDGFHNGRDLSPGKPQHASSAALCSTPSLRLANLIAASWSVCGPTGWVMMQRGEAST
jgi:hypothetical protein